MIRILDKHLADKIAAGEVVERPLSIIKELVENSIDAGSNSITAEIKDGGKSYIRVTDNGCGIEADQVKMAFLRHATSKIFTDSDLEHIETLGFRGEALASISAVSRCEMITRTDSEKTGTHITIEGSDLVSVESIGCPKGTTIVVSDLFYNTPARQKFMRSDAAESASIIDFISKMSVAYPDIKMRLINNGNILFSTRGDGDPINAIYTVYDNEIGKSLIPLRKDDDDENKKIFGYISRQGFSKPSRKAQVFFVNGRNISSKIMEKGVSEAYADKLPTGRHPVCFLFLEVAPEKLDVNIHPNKKEVRFDNDDKVSAFIEQALKGALLIKEAIPEIKIEKAFKYRDREKEFAKQVDINNILSMIQTDVEYVKESPAPYIAEKLDMKGLSVTGSLFSVYITAIDDEALYLIDQHAAHERVLYERLMAQYSDAEKAKQILLLPFVTETSIAVKEDAYSWLDALNNAGFEIEEFGSKSYIIKAVPAFMGMEEARNFIEFFLENISESNDFKDIRTIEKIISNACRSAIKAGDSIKTVEAGQLLLDLSNCENPYNCPHGRPTFIKLTKDEIEKMFKRR